MKTHPGQQYENLMVTIRQRFDVIEVLRPVDMDVFSKAETVAFHGRKIIEGIAFACLVAIDNGLKHVPKDAKGQWNAEKILKKFSAKNIQVFPSPSVIRKATEDECAEHDVNLVVEGIPDHRLSHDDLIKIYKRLHKWLHEINPYTGQNREQFINQNETTLWQDLAKLHNLVERHFISIKGTGFFCTLRDSQDGRTKVMMLTKETKLS